MPARGSGYNQQAVQWLKNHGFDRTALGARGLPYERLDQLTLEVLMGAR